MTQFPKWLVEEGFATPDELARIEAEVVAIVDDATDKALAAEQPGPETIYDHLFSPGTSAARSA